MLPLLERVVGHLERVQRIAAKTVVDAAAALDFLRPPVADSIRGEDTMSHRGRILAIDDEDSVLEIYRDLLEPLGWELSTAKSYVEATERLDEGSWDVVLLDQRLRGSRGSDREGLGLIQEIEHRSPGAKSIIVTGYASPEAIERAFEEGAYDYVEKTQTFETLLRVKIEHAMELHRQRWLVHADDAEAHALWEQTKTETNAQRKGRRLEDLLELLLRSIPGFIVKSRRRGKDEEFDLVVRNESTDPLWSKEGSYFLIACKNWSAPCGPEVPAPSRKSNLLIVPIGPVDLQRLVEANASDRSEVLMELHQRTVETAGN